MLATAIMIANQYHCRQKDKVGQPYILHPLRVMLQMETEDEQVVAVLHDVLEDTDCTVKYLFEVGLPHHIIEAVALLTRNSYETYDTYIDRVKNNPLATKVKIADLQDNMSRIGNLPEDKQKSLLERYTKAYRKLAIKDNEPVSIAEAYNEGIDDVFNEAAKSTLQPIILAEAMKRFLQEPQIKIEVEPVERPSWDDFFMGIAKQVARRSNCSRRKFGCVLVRDNQIISAGYNGTPMGTPNCIDGGCPRCAGNTPPNEGYDKCVCVHSEANAILLAARNGNSTNGTTLYIGTRPCMSCLKELIQAGVKEVVFEEDYRYDDIIEKAYQGLIHHSGIILRTMNYREVTSFEWRL